MHSHKRPPNASACSGEVGTGSPIKNMRQARIYSHFRLGSCGLAIQFERKWRVENSRMGNPVDYAINHARLTIAALAFLLIAGLVAYVTIPKEAEPDVKIPILY